jgi:hypothetical protein
MLFRIVFVLVFASILVGLPMFMAPKEKRQEECRFGLLVLAVALSVSSYIENGIRPRKTREEGEEKQEGC